MADIAALKQHLEAHPEDHDQRWRLAKKLYMAQDYVSALPHLETLDREWVRKINVVRYLGASYYRLGRYDDSARVLQNAIREWPAEIGHREQLAHVFEAAGRKEEAVEVWKQVLELNPKHSRALRTITKFSAKRQEAMPGNQVVDTDDDLALSPAASLADARVCPNCGAQNSDEFDRCWRCHASFMWGANPPISTVMDTKPPRAANKPQPASSPNTAWPLIGGIATAVALVAGAAFTVRYLLAVTSASAEQIVAPTIQGVFAIDLLSTRLVVGLFMLGIWPLAIWMGVMITRANSVPPRTTLVTGLFLASLAYLVSWGPPTLAVAAWIILLAAGLAPILVAFGLSYGRAALVWLIHVLVVVSAALVLIAATEGFAALEQLPEILAYSRAHDAIPNTGHYPLTPTKLPVECPLRWKPTGSAWLDRKAARVLFEVRTDDPGPELTIELKDESGTLYYENAAVNAFAFAFRVTPDRPYKLIVTGKEGSLATITLHGALEPRANE